jgi:cellulose synthase/poly-beta-1,6-N-acetylglucosamine synthase-like glycosyltransferase
MHPLFALFDLVLALAAVLLLIPVAVLFLQVAMAVRPGRSASPAATAARPAVTVLMPAHNEAVGIAASIRSVRDQLAPGDRLLVVADNCSDDTVAVAQAAGAEVVQRHDAARRGKGYALDFGVRHLAAHPPAIVVFVDADCQLHAGAIDRLAQACARTGGPVQALYLMRSPAGAGLKTRMAEFAWRVKNEVRPLGFARLGLPCQLTGTGMAFPWPLIADAPLASGHLVEDMQLGVDLAGAGTPPMLCHDALVTSVFPSDAQGIASQRTRWEHGHLGVIATQGPRLLVRAIAQRRIALVAMTLDLCVPPLASLVLMLAGVLVPALLLAAVGGSTLPLALAVTAWLLLVGAIIAAWSRFGRAIVSLTELLTAPAYVLRKIPIYLKLLTGRQVEWIRTKRDGHGK